MEVWNGSSKQIDNFTHGDIYLTLASWQPGIHYSPSFEIGYRNMTNDDFTLIQFRMSRHKAWDIVKKLVVKGRNQFQVQRVLDYLESR